MTEHTTFSRLSLSALTDEEIEALLEALGTQYAEWVMPDPDPNEALDAKLRAELQSRRRGNKEETGA